MGIPLVLGIVFVAAAFALLLHHGWAHNSDPPDSAAKRESCWPVCFFQPVDVRNHETWILVLLTNGVTLLVMA